MPESSKPVPADGKSTPTPLAPSGVADIKRTPGFSAVSGQNQVGQDRLPEIIDLLRTETAHDFTHYKHGTLLRRVERRMAMAAIEADGMDRYLAILREDAAERANLASDLLINVTSFFRDPLVFDYLGKHIVPDLVRSQPLDHPLRIWVAGCSTGEESYSLSMLFLEQIFDGPRNVKLQVFASDIDADAVATARDGLYPESIAAEVSPARLARFFTREGRNYRVSPELRATVVFTVQDILADPPFSRLDLVSCRNVMIYLQPEAQKKVIALFKFALRPGGLLLLGKAETVGNSTNGFSPLSKTERLYRRVGRTYPGEVGFPIALGNGVRIPTRSGQDPAPTRQSGRAELCRQLVLDSFAPATVLIDRQHDCLFSLGPTDRYLRLAPGAPTHDVLSMVREDVRFKLRSVIQTAWKDNAQTVITDGRMTRNGDVFSFSIVAKPVVADGEELMLICFIDGPKYDPLRRAVTPAEDLSRVAELELELQSTKAELEGAIRNLEISSEEQQAINEEALSINEEYQSTNEELVTSKEELQSLNEELTALNYQLQETLEVKRTTSNDLQNVLYSSDVATLLLDTDLKIRIYTPAVKLLFNVIPSDVGRPLADLSSLAADHTLLSDARSVLRIHVPLEREIEANDSAWYVRRISPYRTQDNTVEGIVITFTDITERHRVADRLGEANRQAQTATIAKSRFLAAASHDLRQPLQTLVLLQGLLAKAVEGDKARQLVTRLDETVGAMAGMLNKLLDINQIDAGTIRTEIVGLPVNDLLNRLKDEFIYHAQALGLAMHVVPCGLTIESDPRLLEQMLRNLLTNALKYTKSGKVLLGCRRHGGAISIEVGDTGVGVPPNELQAIFDEYHQLDNAARERGRGLGLGLSIVRRLGNLLGHPVTVRSKLGKGSIFAIEVKCSAAPSASLADGSCVDAGGGQDGGTSRHGSILIIENDPEVRELLALLLKEDGHRVTTVSDGIGAMELAAHGGLKPDLILAEYSLPGGMDGLQVGTKLREMVYRQIPIIILTGDVSSRTLREITLQNGLRLAKPVRVAELTRAIGRLLQVMPLHAPADMVTRDAVAVAAPDIYIVDDDAHIRDGIREILEEQGRTVETYACGEDFLCHYRVSTDSCLLIDAYLPGINGFELLQKLKDMGQTLPAIMITGYGDVGMAVQAMKAGALDFIEKPIGPSELLASIDRALEQSRDSGKLAAWRDMAVEQLATLTQRQHEIMGMVLAGHPSKNIAADLGISQRTVENHRASIMKKTGLKSLPALARLALFAAGSGEVSH